jgi:hypothetical protein
VTAEEVADAKFESPPYVAVMEWVPCVKAAVANVATPDVTVPVPSEVVPSMNWTVPVADAGVTVAVKVTTWFTLAGFGFAARATKEVPFTFWFSSAETAAASDESPPYAAVIECVPWVKLEVENVATPDASAAVPITAPLSKNCTVPVAAVGVTVAVNVTACPTVEGFALDASATEETAFTFWLSAAEVAAVSDESPP